MDSQWWRSLGFPSVFSRPSTPRMFQRLCLNWVQCHWLGLSFLNYNYSLVLFLENYTLVPLIGVLNIPNLFSHTFTVSGFLSTDGWTHALCMGFTGGVSEGKSILECCWFLWSLPCFIHMCGSVSPWSGTVYSPHRKLPCEHSQGVCEGVRMCIQLSPQIPEQGRDWSVEIGSELSKA